MANFLFNKCCFCIDLRLGCFILGFLELVFSSIGAIVFLILIASKRMYISPVTKKVTDDKILLVLTIAYLVLLMGCIAFAIVLIIGLYKHISESLKSYLMYEVFFVVSYIILLVLDVCLLKFRLGDFLGTVGNLLLNFYALLVVRSYYYKMVDEEGA